jgi:hypothetical protein
MIQSQFLLKEITFIKNEEKVRILRKLSNSNNYENVLLTSPHPTDKKNSSATEFSIPVQLS